MGTEVDVGIEFGKCAASHSEEAQMVGERSNTRAQKKRHKGRFDVQNTRVQLRSLDLFCLGLASLVVGRTFAVIGFLYFVVWLSHFNIP